MFLVRWRALILVAVMFVMLLVWPCPFFLYPSLSISLSAKPFTTSDRLFRKLICR